MTFNLDPTLDTTQGDTNGQPNQQPGTQDQSVQGADNGITPEKLAEILKRDEHAQHHISTLENENKTIRDNFEALQDKLAQLENQLASQKKVEELLARKYTSNNQESDQGTQNNMNTPTTIDQAQIDSLIAARMSEFMSNQEQSKNFTTAQTELNKLFKDKSDDHVKDVAAKNGLTFETATELAKTNPTLFNNLFINPYKGSSHSAAPTFGSQSTSSVPTAQNEITMEYWNKLRRENPTKWRSVETQKSFHQWFHANQNK